MRRRLWWVALGLACCLAVAGCGGTDGPATDGSDAGDSPPATSGTSAEGIDPIATEGAGESAALAALPAALEAARQIREAAGAQWPDLAGAEPLLEAYLIRVGMGEEVAFFEVWADGKPHNLHAYQKAFDAGSILWTPKESALGPTAEPQSDAEKAAVAAVKDVMADAFPDVTLAFAVHGYRFVYVKGGMVMLILEVDPAGGVISVGS